MTRPLQVGVRLTGGLGDVLIASTVLERQYELLPSAEVTVFYHTPEIAEFVFSGARFVHAVKPVAELTRNIRRSSRQSSGHDLLLYTGHFPRWVIQNRVAFRELASSRFQEIVAENERKIALLPGLVDRHPQLDGFWARWLQRQQPSANYLDGLGWVTGLEINAATHPLLSLDPGSVRMGYRPRDVSPDRPYLTIHDGFDNRQKPDAGSATKTWGLKQWTDLVQLLRSKYPDHAVVQLGAGKSRPIPGVDVQLIGRTALSETAWLLKSSALHVDTDSGLAHMAFALSTPAVVMFGPTNVAYFGHRGNLNLASSQCADCWWTTPDWLAKCPRGLVVPSCMTEIEPARVLTSVESVLVGRQTAVIQASCLHLYDGMREEQQSMADCIAKAAGLEPGPITEHLIDPQTGVYVHASKQWEYSFALQQMRERFAGAESRLRVADVGGGRGALAAYLARHSCDVEQFDRDYAWGKSAASEQEYQRWAKSRGYAARFGSIYNLPAQSSNYDVVLCISVLEHLPEKTAALRELIRILKPGGLCILTFDLAVRPEQFTDKMRVGVASPELLSGWLDSIGAKLQSLPDADVEASCRRISGDGVKGIPEGMTVAGITLQKVKAESPAWQPIGQSTIAPTFALVRQSP